MVVMLQEVATVARRKLEKTTPVRITDEAIRWARIASGYTGESVAEYVSRIVAERGQADADELHARVLPRPPAGRPPQPPKLSDKRSPGAPGKGGGK